MLLGKWGDQVPVLFENVTVVSAVSNDIHRTDETGIRNDGEMGVIRDAFVLVEGEKISYIGKEQPRDFSGERIDGRRKVLMPGLINAHTHLPMTAFRGFADDYDLQTWLYSYIFPAEDKLTAGSAAVFTDLAIAEMIASGTTSLTDMYFFSDTIAERVAESGIKANISRAVTFFDEDYDFHSDNRAGELVRLVEEWHGFDHGRIRIEASIHAEYTSNPKVWTAVSDYAASKGLRMQVHLSETRSEHERCIEKYGMTPAAVLARYGVFDVPASAAHCVWVDQNDIEILAQKCVSVVHNPVSNMKLASGIAPVTDMLTAGVNVALGTDGVSSNNSFDMFEEIKMASLAAKVRSLDPTAVKASQALIMATSGGAAAQGRRGECGMIREGMDADLILIDFDRPHLIPAHDIVSNLVYSARGSDVVMNMVRGRIIYKEGEFLTIDLEKVKREAEKAAGIFR